jgi:predicted NACHT family NTPase
MARSINDPVEQSEEETQTTRDDQELLYELQQVVQQIIIKHNEVAAKVEKLEEKITENRIQIEAQKLVWTKGL